MKLEMRKQMRLEQRMMLAPRMIQAMELLQLPILALQERIEQELNNNPVLELADPSTAEDTEALPGPEDTEDPGVAEKDLVVEVNRNNAQDFERLERADDELRDFINQDETFRFRPSGDEADNKLQAIKNTAAPAQSLHDYLMDQWGLVDAEEPVKKAGDRIIDFIDERGYLSVRLEQLHNKDKADFTFDDLKKALELVQKLEPSGVGARDLKECLLIQMAQSLDDMTFEARLVCEHMDALLENHLPDIAKKMKCSIDRINLAVKRMSRLDTSPGLRIGPGVNQPVTPDVIVERDESGAWTVRLPDTDLPTLRISGYYEKMSKDNSVSEKTRKFLRTNIRSAQWIIQAIEQRKNTLLRVAHAIIKFQADFLEKGQLYLKPLPMAKIAEEVGVHVATVSRAVAGKYIQCPSEILPLRKFFSGGTEQDHAGNSQSWQAVKAKLRRIIDSEDKANPLNDDEIMKQLIEAGTTKIARRTVAKYRKLLNIPPARFRKKY
jgi:RNA polymerase sigma-54 factor